MARKHLNWSVCDSLMNVRIHLFLIKMFDLFFDDEMKSQYKQKSQLRKCSNQIQFLCASGFRWWTLKSQMSICSFMPKMLCALSLFNRNPRGYEGEYHLFLHANSIEVLPQGCYDSFFIISQWWWKWYLPR